MKRRLLVPIITAGVALASGVASANPAYWRQNGLLLEVSADPRDGSDFVQTDPTHANRLELVALNDAVRLRALTINYSDGTSFSQRMSTLAPGNRIMVNLPPSRAVIQSVQLDYGPQWKDRTPARLQIIPHDDPRAHGPYGSYHRPEPSYGYPSSYAPSYPPSYTVQPRPTWSGSIQGSIHF